MGKVFFFLHTYRNFKLELKHVILKAVLIQ